MEQLKEERFLTLDKNRKENKQIKFRVSDDEFQKLEVVAKESGMSVSACCKKKDLGVQIRPPKVDQDGASELAHQLRSIGNKMNQLTRRAYEGKAFRRICRWYGNNSTQGNTKVASKLLSYTEKRAEECSSVVCPPEFQSDMEALEQASGSIFWGGQFDC